MQLRKLFPKAEDRNEILDHLREVKVNFPLLRCLQIKIVTLYYYANFKDSKKRALRPKAGIRRIASVLHTTEHAVRNTIKDLKAYDKRVLPVPPQELGRTFEEI